MKILSLAAFLAFSLFLFSGAAHALKAPPRKITAPKATEHSYGNNDSAYATKDRRSVRRKSIENRRRGNDADQAVNDERTASQKKLTEPPKKSSRRKAAQAKRTAKNAPSNTASAGVNN